MTRDMFPNTIIRTFGAMALLPALIAAAAAQVAPPNEREKPLPIEKVAQFLAAQPRMTSIQKERGAAELVGKRFTGIVVVEDVSGRDSILLETVIRLSSGSEKLYFSVKDKELMKKAADLNKGDMVLIDGRLTKFDDIASSFKNEPRRYWASLADVTSIERRPKDESKATK